LLLAGFITDRTRPSRARTMVQGRAIVS